MLSVSGLTTHDGTVQDATFEVRAGEIVGVAGLVGCGKSELALALAGVIPAHGEIAVHSRGACAMRSPRSAMAAGIGFIPEDRKRSAIFPTRSVLHNLSAAWSSRLARLGILNVGSEQRMASAAVERFRIKTSSLRASILHLSGGNQQKVVLGRCFALAPRVIVLSEPTRGIDVGAKSEVYQIIQDMAEAGAGVLMVSSELPELLGLTDRILVMFRGRIEAEFETANATEEGIAAIALRARRRRGGRMSIRRRALAVRTCCRVRHLSLGRYMGVLVGIAAIFAYLAFTEPVFLTWANWQNIIRSQAVVLTLGLGMTFVVLTGGIDLSIASAAAGVRDGARHLDRARRPVVAGRARRHRRGARRSASPTAS